MDSFVQGRCFVMACLSWPVCHGLSVMACLTRPLWTRSFRFPVFLHHSSRNSVGTSSSRTLRADVRLCHRSVLRAQHNTTHCSHIKVGAKSWVVNYLGISVLPRFKQTSRPFGIWYKFRIRTSVWQSYVLCGGDYHRHRPAACANSFQVVFFSPSRKNLSLSACFFSEPWPK